MPIEYLGPLENNIEYLGPLEDERDYNLLPESGQQALEQAINPLRRAYEIQQEEAIQGQGAIQQAISDPSLGNIALGGLGALQYLFSPVTGVARGIAGEPTHDVATGAGAPEPVARFLGETAEAAAYLAPIGEGVKTALLAKEAAGLPGFIEAQQAAKVAGRGARTLGEAEATTERAGKDIAEIINPVPEQPFAGSLAYGQELPELAGNIRLDRLGLDYDAKKLIVDTADRYKGTIDEARRGVITQEETRSLADNLGMTTEQLLKRRKGKSYNAEELLASREILTTSANNVRELQRLAVEAPTTENLIRFQQGLKQHAGIQSQVSGAEAEAGRALSSLRILATPGERLRTKSLDAVLKALGGREQTEEIARRMAQLDLDNPLAVNKFIRDVTKVKATDKLYEVWINSLLSAPATHIANTVGNTLTFANKIIEDVGAATIEAGKSAITGKPRERFFGEALQDTYGALAGIRTGINKAIWSFNNEMSTAAVNKIETRVQQAIKGRTGEIVRIPGRALTAMDEFFKALNYNAELHKRAYRMATKQGLKGEAKAKKIAEIVADPDIGLIDAAEGEMLYRVFQKELGETGKSVESFRRSSGLAKIVLPFLRTPVNIAKYGIERTPLNIPNIIRKSAKGELKGGALSDELAKTLVGTFAGIGSFLYALDGSITGSGPKNSVDRAALMRTGWQPYSIKVGDQYVSYQRTEPVGMVVGLSADLAETWSELDDLGKQDAANALILAISRNITSKTFLKGLSDTLKAIDSPTQFFGSYSENLAGSLVPSVVGAVERTVSPTFSEINNPIEKVISRIPGASDTLYPKRDLWGEPIKIETTAVERLISPIYRKEAKTDIVNDEIVRLSQIDPDIRNLVATGKPSKKIKGVELTPFEYDNYVTESGQKAKARLNKLVRTNQYKMARDETKAKAIKQIIDAERGKVRNAIYLGISDNRKGNR